MGRPSLTEELKDQNLSSHRLYQIFSNNLKKREILKLVVEHPNASLDLLKSSFEVDADLRPNIANNPAFSNWLRNDPSYKTNDLYHNAVLESGKVSKVVESLIDCSNFGSLKICLVMGNVNYQQCLDPTLIDLVEDEIKTRLDSFTSNYMGSLASIIDSDLFTALAIKEPNVLRLYVLVGNFLAKQAQQLVKKVEDQGILECLSSALVEETQPTNTPTDPTPTPQE